MTGEGIPDIELCHEQQLLTQYRFKMAASDSPSMGSSNNTQISNIQGVPSVTQQQQDKSAGVPLSDFVLQLEDYAPTVRFL